MKKGDGITIEVLRVKGKQVRIRIAVPAEVRVLRNELSPHRRNAQTGDLGTQF